MESKHLSRVEEYCVLKALIAYEETNEHNDYMQGSSRIVYQLPQDIMDNLCNLLELPHSKYVIKVACGKGGLTQMKNEVDAWLNSDGDFADCLCSVAAYGEYIEIMDCATPLESLFNIDLEDTFDTYDADEFCFWAYAYPMFQDLVGVSDPSHSYMEMIEDAIGTELDYSEDYAKANQYIRDFAIERRADLADKIDRNIRIAHEAFHVYCHLEEVFGDTKDNIQIGYNLNEDKASCYDYGFRGDGWGYDNEWSSSIASQIESAFDRSNYLLDLCELITNRGSTTSTISNVEAIWDKTYENHYGFPF